MTSYPLFARSYLDSLGGFMKNTPTIRTHKQLCKLLFFRLSTYKKIHLLTIIILTLVSATGCSKDKMDSAQNDPTSNENSVDSNSNMDKTKTLTFNTNMNHCETLLNKNSASENKNNPKNYNKAGYSLYKQKKYNEAALLFRCSTLQDKNYTVGYYNLACTMALLHKQGVNVDINEIFILLRKSVELDPERIEKIRTDSDLDSIRETAEYKKLVSEASIPKANKSPLVEKLCAFENWTFVDSEGPPPTYIFTDKEYCLMGASLKYTKKNTKMI